VAGWSTKLITEVAGGGVAGLGGIGLLVNMLMRKSKALRVVNSELSDDAKAKVKKALQHTGLEKEVT
jgi:threonine dehydrogenase-like Zn-dependent dehydrogenase